MSFTLLFNLKLQSEVFPENTEQHTLHDQRISLSCTDILLKPVK